MLAVMGLLQLPYPLYFLIHFYDCCNFAKCSVKTFLFALVFKIDKINDMSSNKTPRKSCERFIV